jgi:hypothetical protein
VIGLLARQNTAPPTGAAPSTGYTVPTPTPSYQPEAPPSPPTQLGPTVEPSIAGPPGTDAQGWIAYPAARCDPGTQPAAIARTTQSVLVVCQIQPGTFYYRGVRLSDGASIELANAVRSSVGFDVTNPTDGTRYQIRPTSLTHRAAGWKGVDGADTGIRIKLVHPGVRFGLCSNHLVAQRRSHTCLLLRPSWADH